LTSSLQPFRSLAVTFFCVRLGEFTRESQFNGFWTASQTGWQSFISDGVGHCTEQTLQALLCKGGSTALLYRCQTRDLSADNGFHNLQIAAMAVSTTEPKSTSATPHHAAMDSSHLFPPADTSPARIPVQPPPAVEHLGARIGSTGIYHVDANDMQNLNEAVSNLHVDDGNSSPGKGLPKGAEINGSLKVDLAVEDDQTHLSNSSTKPASLDGKSVASGATFALDEKESLRPDDSASVKAAEEEESFSGPASGTPNSRVGSEAGSRAFRDQFYEISERMVVPLHRGAASNRFGVPGIKEEDSPSAAPSNVPVVSDSLMSTDAPFRGMATPYGFAQEGPDEKILEALESPKDRLFLLKLEQDVISFVRDSK